MQDAGDQSIKHQTASSQIVLPTFSNAMKTIPHLAESDYREPLFTIRLPIDDSNNTGLYGIYWLSDAYWIEVLACVCATVAVAALTAVLLYFTIIGPKKTDTSTAYLWGYGLFLPFWLAWPLVVNPLLGFRNLLFKFIVGGIVPTVVEFKLLEAIHGCCPAFATESLSSFVLYFSSVLLFERDEKTKLPIPTTNRLKFQHLASFLTCLVCTGLFQSILTPFQDFNVFGEPVGYGSSDWWSWRRLLSWELYANSLMHAILFQLYLTLYCQGLTLFWHVVGGYQTQPAMINPLGKSTSPSEFWGRRWNRIVHHVLKGGIYKPLRKHGVSSKIAMLWTFLLSGAFHEWLLCGIFYTTCVEDPEGASCYHPFYGGALVFFGWQALLVALEHHFGSSSILQSISRSLPSPVRTILIVLLGVPMAHFFLEPYVRSVFFRHGQMGLPMIIRIE